MIEQDFKAIFYDKRDEHYYAMDPNHCYFMDMFQHKKHKCHQKIPETLVIQYGVPKFWFFNSQKDDHHGIMTKNIAQESEIEIIKLFSNLKEIKLPTTQSSQKLIHSNYQSFNQQSEVFCKFESKKSQIIAKKQLLSNYLNTFNQLLPVSHQSQNQQLTTYRFKLADLYYVEYRKDKLNDPSLYKYVKKCNHDKDKYHPSMLRQNQQSFKSKFYKIYDSKFLERLKQAINELVNFLEVGYKIFIRKIIGRFMINDQNELIYLGANQILISIPDQTKFYKHQLTDLFSNKPSFTELYQFFKTSHQKSPPPKRSFFAVTHEKLFKPSEITQSLKDTFVTLDCGGDFCDFILQQANKQSLTLNPQVKINPFLPHSASLNKQQFYIPNNLIQKVRQNWPNLKAQLTSMMPNENCKINIIHQKISIQPIKNIYQLIQQYANISICKTCQFVYQYIQTKLLITPKKHFIKKTLYKHSVETEYDRVNKTEAPRSTMSVMTGNQEMNFRLSKLSYEQPRIQEKKKNEVDILLKQKRQNLIPQRDFDQQRSRYLEEVEEEQGYQIEDYKVYHYNDETKLPFQVLESTMNENYQVENVMVFHDMFDSFNEHQEFWQNQIKSLENVRIIIFNYPAYTKFDQSQIYNNIYISQIIDRFLFYLLQQKIINQYDSMKFIGLGLGGYYLISFISLIQQYNKEIFNWVKCVYIVNGFIHINDQVKLIANKLMDIIDRCPRLLREHIYKYVSIILYQKNLSESEIKQKAIKNPISIEGRYSILNGIIHSQSILSLIKELNQHMVIYRSPTYNQNDNQDGIQDFQNLNIDQKNSSVLIQENISIRIPRYCLRTKEIINSQRINT